MGNRQNCAKFQENLFRSNEIISIFCPPLFRKRPIRGCQKFQIWVFDFPLCVCVSVCVGRGGGGSGMPREP